MPTAPVARKAPTTVIVVAGSALAVVLVCAVTFLIYTGHDTAPIYTLIQTVLSAIGGLTATGAFLYAGSAARSAANTEQQTNGALDRRIVGAVHTVLDQRGMGANPQGHVRPIDSKGGENVG